MGELKNVDILILFVLFVFFISILLFQQFRSPFCSYNLLEEKQKTATKKNPFICFLFLNLISNVKEDVVQIYVIVVQKKKVTKKKKIICTLTVLNETLFQKLNIRTKYVQFLS